MIKKLLTTGIVLSSLVIAKGQENRVWPTQSVDRTTMPAAVTTQAASANKTAIVNIQDTLFYFYNKNVHKYNNSFYTVKAPHTGSVQVNTEFGTSYLNPGNNTVTISGARVLASRMASSPSPSLNLSVTLYSASPTGVPGASVATATCVISGSLGTVSSAANFSTPVVMTGAYFIAYKHNIANPLDTLNVFLTVAHSPTSTAPATQKFGEGLGYIRNNGNLISTTGYYNTGLGTSELEPIVAPFVSFNFTATNTLASSPTPTGTPGAYCANANITFTSTTEALVVNRQYNYNQFIVHWGAATSTITGLPTGDPVHNWTFAGGVPTPTALYTPTTTTVSHAYATTGNSNCDMIVKYQKGSGSKVKTQDIKSTPLQIVNCGLVGITENGLNANMTIYPNPLTNGKASIVGLEGSNTISVYNIMGQQISTQTTSAEAVGVDLSSQPVGTYMIRVTDSSNRTKVIKVINQ